MTQHEISSLDVMDITSISREELIKIRSRGITIVAKSHDSNGANAAILQITEEDGSKTLAKITARNSNLLTVI